MEVIGAIVVAFSVMVGSYIMTTGIVTELIRIRHAIGDLKWREK